MRVAHQHSTGIPRRWTSMLSAVTAGALAATALSMPAHAIVGDAPQVAVDDTRYGFVGFLRIQEVKKNGKLGEDHSCTTELIAPNVAITAEHCTDFKGFQKGAEIVFGATRRASTAGSALPAGSVYKVDKVVKHPGGADLALLVLDRTVAGVTPVKIAPVDIGNAFQRNAQATLVGWGTIDFAGTATSELRYANHKVTSRNKNRGAHTPAASLTTNPLVGRQWGYAGDSGGALLGVTNGTTYLHGVFVSAYPKKVRDWQPKLTDNYSINIAADGRFGYRDWVSDQLDAIASAGSSHLLVKPAVSAQPIPGQGSTFFVDTFVVDYRSGAVRITGSADGTQPVNVDDVLDVTVSRNGAVSQYLTNDFSAGCSGRLNPVILDLTSMMTTGENTVEIRLRDRCGDAVGNTDVYLNADNANLSGLITTGT